MCVCMCRMDSPEDLYQTGIFINDLAMHDCTREYILAGSQQNPELNLALNQVQEEGREEGREGGREGGREREREEGGGREGGRESGIQNKERRSESIGVI